ncbi:hypothetical protein [Streptomyces sp. Ac-502]|uniref:hypothetical protein n=1 Tax=Streptomyces sp. Ac-502 TaxID=3342801 RepID=UPI00386264CF
MCHFGKPFLTLLGVLTAPVLLSGLICAMANVPFLDVLDALGSFVGGLGIVDVLRRR